LISIYKIKRLFQNFCIFIETFFFNIQLHLCYNKEVNVKLNESKKIGHKIDFTMNNKI